MFLLHLLCIISAQMIMASTAHKTLTDHKGKLEEHSVLLNFATWTACLFNYLSHTVFIHKDREVVILQFHCKKWNKQNTLKTTHKNTPPEIITFSLLLSISCHFYHCFHTMMHFADCTNTAYHHLLICSKQQHMVCNSDHMNTTLSSSSSSLPCPFWLL